MIIGNISETNPSEEMLRHLAAATAGVTGESFFRQAACHLAQALCVRYCFFAECTDQSKENIRSLALWSGEGFDENFECKVSGRPCANVIAGQICAYPKNVVALFPDDLRLASLGAQSYLGLPAESAGGEVLGHLVLMDTEPRRFIEQEISLVRIFAVRAAAELERKRAEQHLRISEQRRQLLLEINNAIITKLNREELFAAIAEALARMLPFDRLALSLYDPEIKALRIVTIAGSYQRADYSPIGRVLEIGDSPAGQAFLHQQPVVRPDLESERRTSSEERAYSHGFRSVTALPLMVRGKGIGAITLGSRQRFEYAETDADFLMEVAKQVAIAIDNMTAHEETAALKARFQAENVYLQEEIKTEHNFEEIIGQSAPVRQLLRQVEQVAPTEASVLILGETGTGKELLARAVHDRSQRKDRPLVKVNCGSIPAGLVESELFGHEKGAFTGATQRRIGRFELADGGTIFLDEISELALDTQVKLLRVLQEGEFERVGSSHTIKVDVRVIAATNRDLQQAVRKGDFRLDLYYRLNVFPLRCPPLRERTEDIPLLVHFFLGRFGKKLGKEVRGVSPTAMENLTNYKWPGNVRELQNVVERAVVLAKGSVVPIDDSILRSEEAPAQLSIDTLENVERNHIIRALNETRWVIHGKKGAAEILGINPSTLRSRMDKLGVKK